MNFEYGESPFDFLPKKWYSLYIIGGYDHITGVLKTYPNLRITVERQIAEGEWVATCITAKGTHQGEWIGIAPTGRQVVDRIVNIKIVEHGGAANMLGPLLEVGAINVVGKEWTYKCRT